MIQTLQSWREIDESRERLRARGLDFIDPLKTRLWRFLFDLRFRYRVPAQVPDYIKSWDVLTTAGLIESEIKDRLAPILDMGCFNSEILYVLDALGYRSLHGCDLNPICRWMPFWNRIRYRTADLTKTPYPDNFFVAATSVSVIEHGVDLQGLVREVKRILRPGGLFVFTTDYDATGQKHDVPDDFKAFGQSWTIFSRPRFHELIQSFKDAGFSFLRPDQLRDTHADYPISWQGQRFTFVLAAMRAPATNA